MLKCDGLVHGLFIRLYYSIPRYNASWYTEAMISKRYMTSGSIYNNMSSVYLNLKQTERAYYYEINTFVYLQYI